MATRQHVLFHDGSPHTEGMGAKWREVKYGLWLTLRLNWLLHSNHTIGWLPNPAMMQNPHVDERAQSMMGGLGIMDASQPVLRQSPDWLHERVSRDDYVKIELRPQRFERPRLGPWERNVPLEHSAATDRRLEQQAVAALASATKPVAFYLTETHSSMHWHGSAGRWLHDAFISHRMRRAERAHGRKQLSLPDGVAEGRYLISIHIRTFDSPAWNFPSSYYTSAVQSVFAATPLSCANSAILVIGPSEAASVQHLGTAFECAHVLGRVVKETHAEPKFDRDARDDYSAADDTDDGRRGHVFRDLELLALSDVTIGSNSEFSRMAQSLSAPETIVLCAPRRPDSDNFAMNRGLPCDQTGVPNSIRTRLDALPSDQVTAVDAQHVATELAEAWRRRRSTKPIWSQPNHGLAPFDFGTPVEEARWHDDRFVDSGTAATQREEL